MFNKYFEEELAYLHETGLEFATKNPALAQFFEKSRRDPDVERLLEGVAFLTGRIRQKLDDELPELIHATAALLFPHLLRPTPAASILELIPKPQVIRERRVVAAGSEFATEPSKAPNALKTSCRFSSTRDCEVFPWTLEGTRLEARPDGGSAVIFQLKLAPGMTLGMLEPESVCVHVAEEVQIALLLTYFVVEKCRSITVTARTPNATTPDVLALKPDKIRQIGLEENDSLLPCTEHVLPGFRLVQEYFMLPQKFAFFEISGLRKLSLSATKATSLDISIELNEQPQLPRELSADCLKVHCVPIVNVFRTTAEPINVKPGREMYRVQPDSLPREHSSVYALLKVLGVNASTDKRSDIPPFFDYSHVNDLASALCYVTTLQPSVVGDDADFMISIDHPGSKSPVDVRTLSIELLATNGHRGHDVRINDVSKETRLSPTFVDFRNLTRATPYIPVPLGNEIHWRVVAHLATGLRTLADAAVLRAALRIYNLHGLHDQQAAAAHDRRINALLNLNVFRAERLLRGSIIRGIDVRIELDESGFIGKGDTYLFGAVLDRLFASYVPLNAFAVTGFKGTKGLAKTFPPRSGRLKLDATLAPGCDKLTWELI